MDESLALTRLGEIVALIDEQGAVYDARWETAGGLVQGAHLQPRLTALDDEVRRRARLASDLAAEIGERALAERIVEHEEGMYGGHPWQQARKAIVELYAVLEQREELAAILGPLGPRLEVGSMHPAIWGAAAGLWDDGHFRQAVQTAGQALEGVLQVHAGPALSGERLAGLFSTSDPTSSSPRLRIRGVDVGSPTWTSVHEGAAGLVRGAMMAVRNLVSHPGWPDPSEVEALEMLAVMSYVAHLADRCEVELA